MSEPIFDRTMAFAGILQAIGQVQKVARHGQADEQMLGACLNTIMVTNPDSTADVYSDKTALNRGYQLVVN